MSTLTAADMFRQAAWQFLVIVLVSLSFGAGLWFCPPLSPQPGPESVAAGAHEAAPAVLEGSEELGECLLEHGEGRPVLLELILQVEPDPAQRSETATARSAGACAAPVDRLGGE
jgi:hypothetical protein